MTDLSRNRDDAEAVAMYGPDETGLLYGPPEMPTYEPEPKLDWKPGDRPEWWPHGYVESSRTPGRCGVVIDNATMQRCWGAPHWKIHNA